MLVWMKVKAKVLENLKKAGITNKGAIKAILFVERKMVTAANAYSRGATLEWIGMNVDSEKLDEAFRSLGNKAYQYNVEGAPYWAEWEAYCKVTNTDPHYLLTEIF